ncbi:HNH endonuclease [Gordonia neofelifaecis]|uniref:HNH nuclease domain-containing protein n=1 Tax=Gordonia neofelifaecis NRRL B-59395 TaxID=644548 RepID=F1YDZ2_9ACTN|nr:HNH endonuclease [Gordonia neofelifaecis]EGD57082.1 hypothetical protein SCNU_01870 [Gordonia neofelifaecis NRRL B-59395]
MDIQTGDNVYFWQAGRDQLVGWVEATSDAVDLDDSMPRGPWDADDEHEYKRRFEFVVKDELSAIQRWKVTKAATNISQGPNLAPFEIVDSAAEAYIQGLFTARFDDDEVQAADTYDPRPGEDLRTTSLRAIKTRQGQPEFRRRLLSAYRSRCAITGTTAVPVLEAAHIDPHRGPHTNKVPNGLLLRSDVHTLFDSFLITIDADYTVCASISLHGTEYAEFVGKSISMPAADEYKPDDGALARHRAKFFEKESTRVGP